MRTLTYYDEKNAIIHLNQNMAPGGYGWVFPKSNGKVNIGIGVQKRSLEIRNQKLGKKDTLHTLMDEYVKSNPVLKNLKLFNKDNNGKGYWSVAVQKAAGKPCIQRLHGRGRQHGNAESHKRRGHRPGPRCRHTCRRERCAARSTRAT